MGPPLYPHNRVSPGARAFLEATDPALPFSTDPLVMCEALFVVAYGESFGPSLESDPKFRGDHRVPVIRAMIEACSEADERDYGPLADLVVFVARIPAWKVERDYRNGEILGCPMLALRLDQLCSRVLASVETLQPEELPILRSVLGVTDAEDVYGAVFGLVEDLILLDRYPHD